MVTGNIYVYVYMYKGLNMSLIKGKGKICLKIFILDGKLIVSGFNGLCLIKIILGVISNKAITAMVKLINPKKICNNVASSTSKGSLDFNLLRTKFSKNLELKLKFVYVELLYTMQYFFYKFSLTSQWVL